MLPSVGLRIKCGRDVSRFVATTGDYVFINTCTYKTHVYISIDVYVCISNKKLIIRAILIDAGRITNAKRCIFHWLCHNGASDHIASAMSLANVFSLDYNVYIYIYVRQIAFLVSIRINWRLGSSLDANTFLRLPPITLCSYSTNRRKSLFYVVSRVYLLRN